MDCLQGITDIGKLCRICLAADSKNIPLENVFERKASHSIFWALEKVMSTKLELHENYPSEMCPNCLSLLNMSYGLRERFQNSQKILKKHFTKCLEDVTENYDNNTVSSQEFVASGENDLITPKLEVYIEENNENVEYIYEESMEMLEEYLDVKTDQENTEQSEGEVEIIQTDNTEEFNESSDKVNKSIQVNANSHNRKKELQIKQLDVDKYIIEKPAEHSAISLTPDHDVKNLSRLDEELIQAAYNLKYECPGCPKLYSSLRNLKKHKETCVRFKRLAGSRSQLTALNEQNTDVDLFEESYLSYECNQCFKCYLSFDELEEHKETVHSESKLNIYEAFKLEDLSELDRELFRGALLLKYECDTCPKVYSSPDKLEKHKAICEKHRKKHLRKSKTDVKISLAQPDSEEDKSAKLMEEIYLDHLPQTERGTFQIALDLQHKCPNCGKLYLTEDRFKRHQTMCEHKGKKYACEKCGKLFAVKSVLKQHMQSHAKDKTKVVCPICGKGFHYSGGLFYHMKMHKKELNYLCHYCNRRFINLNALKRHLASHTGERNYQCRICDKKFKGSSELRTHELLHTDNRPHHCSYCDKVFATKSNLQVHIITHKGNVPCDQCGRMFLDADVLQLHMRIKHKVQEENPLLTC